MTIPYNPSPTLPTLSDLLNTFRQNLLVNFNCHAIGTIQSFDPTMQTATASINYQKTYFVLNGVTQVNEPQLISYPTLVDCPVVILGGGTTFLTFPIESGDECLVLFNDRDMDNWFQGSTTSGVATPRLHSFSDGMILVGIRSLPHVIEEYDAVRAVLRAGEAPGSITAVGVNPDTSKVLITNTYPSNSTTLNSLLSQLISNIKDLVTAVGAITVTPGTFTAPPMGGPVVGVSGTPVNASQISAVTTELTTTATAIAQLLE